MSVSTAFALFSVSAFWQIASATPTHSDERDSLCNPHAPAFFLAGDSTTAIQSSDGGGWGVGFLSYLNSPAWGIDYGVDGATTVSFVNGGHWTDVINSVKDNALDYDPIVTIQFGHNDQKSAANISLSEYQHNLENLSTQVKEAGGTPILVTPLTRRDFTSEHNATDSLHDQRLATIAAAKNTFTSYIDLNQASLEYIDIIGNESAMAYNLGGTDHTHLNAWGSVVFGRMVADLILGHVPSILVDVDWTPSKDNCLTPWIALNQTLSEEIWGGTPA